MYATIIIDEQELLCDGYYAISGEGLDVPEVQCDEAIDSEVMSCVTPDGKHINQNYVFVKEAPLSEILEDTITVEEIYGTVEICGMEFETVTTKTTRKNNYEEEITTVTVVPEFNVIISEGTTYVNNDMDAPVVSAWYDTTEIEEQIILTPAINENTYEESMEVCGVTVKLVTTVTETTHNNGDCIRVLVSRAPEYGNIVVYKEEAAFYSDGTAISGCWYDKEAIETAVLEKQANDLGPAYMEEQNISTVIIDGQEVEMIETVAYIGANEVRVSKTIPSIYGDTVVSYSKIVNGSIVEEWSII
jgi:hypothetical protein